ncbi:MAG: cupin domain-containing protein [Candidatus Paracaedimonas acanthamoebae]|uniref:Cupin domain-containing protein n=1 Tax=Candidatus Paracaedimonas acanthamoebae TaxID=244581 RepID=A0A8J7PJ83_9PROT|nr:cupin domain-containing protein [Candidatus Paracaedimonas acanthamoebae]
MENKSNLHNLFIKISTRARNYLKINNDIQRYHIFNGIPHQRITSKKEIFDLYQLGIFSSSDQKIAENLELVELQPNANYRPHYHKNSTATIYIILGSGEFILNEKHIIYNPGKRILIPAGIMHGFQTKTRTLFLSIQSPPIIDPQNKHIDIHYEKENSYEEN